MRVWWMREEGMVDEGGGEEGVVDEGGGYGG